MEKRTLFAQKGRCERREDGYRDKRREIRARSNKGGPTMLHISPRSINLGASGGCIGGTTLEGP